MGFEVLKAIIFDYNGVLVNDLRIHAEAYVLAGKSVGIPLARETVRKYVSYSHQQKRKPLYGDISDDTWEEISRLKTRFYFDLAEKTDVVFPDVETVLTSLHRRYTLALISNTRRENFDRVFPRKLARLFTATLFIDDVEKPKPFPDLLLKMMERLDIRANQCCYVGDSILDVQMAKKVGIRVFSVATGDNSGDDLRAAGADLVFDNLSELKETLEDVG